MNLDALREQVEGCTLCSLHETRTRVVFGTGNPDADIMLVGEAPGANEDQKGVPFVGKAGKLMTLMLLKAGVKREDVYIANVLKCRPPNNRDPAHGEVKACRPYLRQQVMAVNPKVIVALGKHAAELLTRSSGPMSVFASKEWQYFDDHSGLVIPLLAVYHPAYILRQGKERGRKDVAAWVAKIHRALSLVAEFKVEVAGD